MTVGPSGELNLVFFAEAGLRVNVHDSRPAVPVRITRGSPTSVRDPLDHTNTRGFNVIKLKKKNLGRKLASFEKSTNQRPRITQRV